MKKLTIEIEERDEGVALIRVFVGGKQLGVISRLKLEADANELFVPTIEADVAKGLAKEQVAASSPGLRASMEDTLKALRGFRCVEVRAPEGL